MCPPNLSQYHLFLTGYNTIEGEVIKLTVQSDLQKAIAACESAQGTYKVMAQSTEDQSAKAMYNEMSNDLDKHLNFLNNRVNYITQGNSLNQTQQP